jgi:hypothetical protein
MSMPKFFQIQFLEHSIFTEVSMARNIAPKFHGNSDEQTSTVDLCVLWLLLGRVDEFEVLTTKSMTCGKIGFATNSSKINGLVLIRQHALVCVVSALGTGCPSTVSHQPNEGVVDTLGMPQAQQLLKDTILRSVNPRVDDVEVTDDFMRYHLAGTTYDVRIFLKMYSVPRCITIMLY